MKGQKKEKGKPVEIEGIEEWKVEEILNKRKIRDPRSTRYNRRNLRQKATNGRKRRT